MKKSWLIIISVLFLVSCIPERENYSWDSDFIPGNEGVIGKATGALNPSLTGKVHIDKFEFNTDTKKVFIEGWGYYSTQDGKYYELHEPSFPSIIIYTVCSSLKPRPVFGVAGVTSRVKMSRNTVQEMFNLPTDRVGFQYEANVKDIFDSTCLRKGERIGIYFADSNLATELGGSNFHSAEGNNVLTFEQDPLTTISATPLTTSQSGKCNENLLVTANNQVILCDKGCSNGKCN